jgi:hypothetical protein
LKLSYIRYKFNLEKENDEKLFILSTKEEKRKTHQTIKGKKVNECLKAEKKRCRRKRDFLKETNGRGHEKRSLRDFFYTTLLKATLIL